MIQTYKHINIQVLEPLQVSDTADEHAEHHNNIFLDQEHSLQQLDTSISAQYTIPRS